jgi:hypothetical protein
MSTKIRSEIVAKIIFIANQIGIILMASLLAGCQGGAPDDLLLDTQQTALIFVKSSTSGTLDNNFIGGDDTGDLYSLTPISPNGQLKNLTNVAQNGGAVADPEISYDGLKVIFSMRQTRNESFKIFEMNIDGTNLRRLTNSSFDDCDPVYLPNGKIVFSSNRRNIRDEYERREVENLHTMNADGGNIQCVSFNNSDDFDPVVMADGRVVWTRWEHHGTQNRFPLFFTHPDGQSTFLFFAPHNRNFFHARELPDGKVVAVMSNMVLVDRGPLVILNSDRTTGDPPADGDYLNITPNVPLGGGTQGSFKYPFPLPDGRIVASFSPTGPDGDYGLYTIGRNGGNLTLLYNDLQTHEMDPVVVAPRPKPPVIAETVDRNATTGVFVNQDVYFRQNNDGQARPNKATREIKQVMVIEGIGVPPNERSMDIGETSFERKRVLGVAPVYDDGSFSIRVPANVPISFNTLDSLGRAVVIKRSWLYARPGEKFENCTGCHGPRGQKSNPTPIAATKAPTDLNVAESQREIINFKDALEPIIAQKCSSCHDGLSPAAALNLSIVQAGAFSLAYQNLMSSSRNNLQMVENSNPPFSRRSHLANVLLGVGTRQGLPKHPEGVNALTPEQIRKFITWIDLGGQYR